MKYKRTNTKRLLSLTISLVIFIIVFYFLWNSNVTDNLQFENLNWVAVFFLILNRLLFFFPTGLMLAFFAKSLGAKLSFFEWFGLSIINTVANLVIPGGSAVARAAYLKNRHNLPISQFTSILAISYLVAFATSGFTGLILVLFYWLTKNTFYPAVTFLLVAMAVSPVLISLLPLEQLAVTKNSRLAKIINSALNGWQILRLDYTLLAKQCALAFLNILIQSASLYFSWGVLNIDVKYVDSIFVSILSLLANIIRITPGAIGVAELISGAASELIGIGLTEGIAAAFLVRIGSLLVVLVLGPIFTFKLFDGWSLFKSDTNEV